MPADRAHERALPYHSEGGLVASPALWQAFGHLALSQAQLTPLGHSHGGHTMVPSGPGVCSGDMLARSCCPPLLSAPREGQRGTERDREGWRGREREGERGRDEGRRGSHVAASPCHSHTWPSSSLPTCLPLSLSPCVCVSLSHLFFPSCSPPYFILVTFSPNIASAHSSRSARCFWRFTAVVGANARWGTGMG